MGSHIGQRIDVVRERLDAELGDRLIAFLEAHAALAEPEARERLDEVICVCLDADEQIIGVSSASAGFAPLVGRQFWIYRRFLVPGADQSVEDEMLEAARAELARGFSGEAGEPLGLCVLVADRALIERHPEAVWPLGERYPDAAWPGGDLVFAGYTEAGVQVWISYFEGARI